MDMQVYLQLFQICDSTFPIGTFNHSYGLENYIADGRVKKAHHFSAWLDSFMRSQYAYGEGLCLLLLFKKAARLGFTGERGVGEIKETAPVVHDATDTLGCFHKYVMDLDRRMTVSTLAKETRQAGKLVCKQMYQVLATMEVLGEQSRWYGEAVQKGEAFGIPAILFGLVALELGVSAEESFQMYGYSLASTLVQNAVRAVPLGQKDGQCILREEVGKLPLYIQALGDRDESYVGATIPGLEMAQIRHEVQLARLFMS